MNNEVHHYSTIISTKLHVSKVKYSFAKRCIRYSLPNLINQSPTCITDKLFTHSLKGLSNYANIPAKYQSVIPLKNHFYEIWPYTVQFTLTLSYDR